MKISSNVFVSGWCAWALEVCVGAPARRALRRALVLAALVAGVLPSATALAAPSEWQSVSASASSSLWPASHLVDGSTATIWSSNIHAGPNASEWVTFALSASQQVNYVRLGTRHDGQTAFSFPVDFTVHWSDGARWNKALSVTHYPRPNDPWVTIRLPETVQTRHFWISASVLGRDDQAVNNHVFQLSEARAGFDPEQDMGVELTPTTVHSSSALWPASSVSDNVAGSVWSSSVHATAASSAWLEWLAYWWPQGPQTTNYVRLLPRYFNNVALGFPTDFTVYYSNGGQWVPALTMTAFPRPTGGGWVTLPLRVPVTADGIYIIANKLGKDDVGNFVFQLAEVRAGFSAAYNPELAPCPAAGAQIEVADSMTLNPWCTYTDVTYVVQARPGELGRRIELDCNGVTLTGTPAGAENAILVAPTVLVDDPTRQRLPLAVVKDCRIEGYRDAVKVGGVYGPEVDLALSIYKREAPYDTMSQVDRDAWVETLSRQNRVNGAGDVRFERVYSFNARHHGLYLAGAVQGVTFTLGLISQSVGSAVYFGSWSGGNTFLGNTVVSPNDDGMRIDSSAENLISRNYFYNRGIILFKNCGEDGGPRPQHSHGNVIEENQFVNLVDSGRVGLSIADRSSRDLHQQYTKNWHCSDDIYFTESKPKPADASYKAFYYRDHAEDTVVRGNHFKDGSRLLVQDDGAHISGNQFSGGTSATDGYIVVGSRIRNAAGSFVVFIGQGLEGRLVTKYKSPEPVVNTTVTPDNTFVPSLGSNVRNVP